MSLLDYFLKGGFFMWPLLICSVIALAVIAERFYFFTRRKLKEEEFKSQLHLAIAEARIQEATALCQNSSNSIADIAIFYLRNLNQPQRDKILSNRASLLLEQEEKFLNILAIVARIAPLIGLLGTVAGLVESFLGIESLGSQVKPSDLAGGIWAALMTTVFGLIVAIPAMVFHNYFEAKVDHHARHMQLLVADLDVWFEQHPASSLLSELPIEKKPLLQYQ